MNLASRLITVGIFTLFSTSTFAAEPLVQAVIESTMPSASGHIRQFAFDSVADSYYASEKNATKADHLTLIFDAPVKLAKVSITTGKPKGEDALTAGAVEVSEDGTKFEALAKFTDGKAEAAGKDRKVKAIRIRPTEDLKHPLIVREIALESTPKVGIYRFPIEFTYDISDAPAMKEWIEKTIRICERQYPMLCDELMSDGFKPMTQIRMTLKSDYNGVAATGGGRITGSVKYFKSKPDDIGAMVHETAHCVQNYKGRGNPGWLVEGIADYVRFWKYEPGKAGKVNPDRAKYDASYRTTAAFLAFVSEKYDPKLVNKLNAAMREGKYEVDIWKKLTGKSPEELNQQWKESLAAK
jgi:hypothetical protein